MIVVSALYFLLLLRVLSMYKYLEEGIVRTEEEEDQHKMRQLVQDFMKVVIALYLLLLLPVLAMYKYLEEGIGRTEEEQHKVRQLLQDLLKL